MLWDQQSYYNPAWGRHKCPCHFISRPSVYREVPVHSQWYLPCELTVSSGKHHLLHKNAVLIVAIFQDQSQHLMFCLILARLIDCCIFCRPRSNKCCNAVTGPSSGTPESGCAATFDPHSTLCFGLLWPRFNQKFSLVRNNFRSYKTAI